ncbi:uncharacterized protein LOC124453880 [Xenia sp. Carnegie-2017]|uniref:uncharacterized protein LOC124453880 n=1 Tax=Xenia sp. Carnegie-2017 TaxID=2897299 RepID=UPI001F03EA1C|nr:uncharacterized protein LOC124453880 [Xenia sp. Carnegie-2017]
MMAENIQKHETVDVKAKHESSIDVATDNGQQPGFGQMKRKKSEKDYFIVASQTSTKSREMNSDNFKQQKWNENENSLQGKPFLYPGEKSAFRPTESFLKAGSKLAGPLPSRMKTNNKMIALEPRLDRNRSDRIQAIAKDRSALRSSNPVFRPARGFGSQEKRGPNFPKHDPNNCTPQ